LTVGRETTVSIGDSTTGSKSHVLAADTSVNVIRQRGSIPVRAPQLLTSGFKKSNTPKCLDRNASRRRYTCLWALRAMVVGSVGLAIVRAAAGRQTEVKSEGRTDG
jgi:hypothetical protein